MAATRASTQPAPIRSLVVATDFTPGASQALRRAACLPLARRARISIIHIRPEKLAGRRRERTDPETLRQLQLAEREFVGAAANAGHETLRVTVAATGGKPFLEIIRHARKRRADLIVLGRHGHRTLGALLAGSTAQRVVRHSEIPVLLVNLEPRRRYRRVMLATDLEPGSRHAAGLAARLMEQTDTAVTVVHAYEVPFEGWIAVSDRSGSSAYRRHPYRLEAMRRLRRFVQLLPASGVPSQPRLRHGDPRMVVLAEAARDGTDLLALGSHGRAGLARVLMGTVAEFVVGHARCDVLVVRPPGLSVRLV